MHLCPPCAFAESARNVEGVESYSPRRLPTWLRQRLLSHSNEVASDVSDDELVEAEVEHDGEYALIGWGQATFKGEETFLFAPDALLDPTELACYLGCGLMLVEADLETLGGASTFILTEHPLRRRHRVDSAVSLSEKVIAN